MTSTHRAVPPVARRRSVRAAAGALLALVSSLLFLTAAPAQADEKSLIAEKSGWFWSSNSKITTCTGEIDENNPVGGLCGAASGSGGVQPGTTPGATAPISLGHVGVSMKDGDSDMRGYVKFDNSAIPPGAEITSYMVTLTVSGVSATDQSHVERHSDTNAKPPATANQDQAAILACAVTEPWASAEGDPPYSTTVVRPKPETDSDSDDEVQVTTVKSEPSYDCGLNATGVRSKDGQTWRFDIANIAKKWMSLEVFDEGIALVPVNNSVKPNWVVEFHGAPLETVGADGESEVINVNKKEAARAKVEYTGGGLSFPPPDPGGFAPPPSGGSFAPGPDVGGFDGGEAGTAPPPAAPPAGQPVVGTGGPVGGVAQAQPWLLALIPLGLLGFGMVSGAIGEDQTHAVLGSNRVASVLRSRRIEGASMDGNVLGA